MNPVPSSPYLKIASLAFLFALVFSGIGIVQASLLNGEFCYALDDSFIMMALAKNLAFHGVWGLTPYEFSSTASSPLFTIILAQFFKVFGKNIFMPLIINVAALFFLFAFVAGKSAQRGMNSWQIWIMLMGLFFLMPVPILLFGGMEHILHILIALVVLDRVAGHGKNCNPLWLFFWGLLLGSIRFEGLFEIALLVLWLWKDRAWIAGFVLGAGGILPTLILGFYSLEQGWFFFPNSLILKAYGMNVQETGNALGYLWSLMMKAANHPHAMAAGFVLYLLADWKIYRNEREKELIFVVLGISILHFLFARYNHVYRYEAYLMGIAWVVAWNQLSTLSQTVSSSSLFRFFREKASFSLLILVLIFSPLYRSAESYAVGTRAMCNIYDQQVQMARFVQQYYPKETVGVLDIGALAYYSDCRILDIWGLASMEFARLKLSGNLAPDAVNRIFEKHRSWLAVIYGNNLNHPNWRKMRSWVIYRNAVCSRDTISFICLKAEKEKSLLQNIKAFEKKLPASVQVVPENIP